MSPARFPPAFATGLRLFNRGDFFAAHEAFEELLEQVEGDERWDCLVALIQVAVGYHKCMAGHPGAARMLALGAGKLAKLPPVLRGLDVDRLRRRVAEDLAVLEAGNSLELAALPPRIEMARRPQSPPA